MNSVRRTITISAVTLVAAGSTIPLAGSASACEYVVDSYTGSARCVEVPQPATGLSIVWLWIGLAVVLATAVAIFVVRWRPLKHLPAPAPMNANAGELTGGRITEQAKVPSPRLAEAEGQRWPVEPGKLPSSR